MRVVIDTNVFYSSFFGGNPARIIELWKQEKFILCVSESILDEYIRILQAAGLPDERDLTELLTFFSTGFNLIFARETLTITAIKEDPDDNKFVECAVALNADVI